MAGIHVAGCVQLVDLTSAQSAELAGCHSENSTWGGGGGKTGLAPKSREW